MNRTNPHWAGVPRIILCPHAHMAVTPEQVFRVTGCPEPHRSRWLRLVSRQPPGYWQDLMAGPGLWLLSRLVRFPRITAWSNRGLPWDSLDDPIHREWGMEAPSEAASFFAPTAGPAAMEPLLLPVEDHCFADAVAACVLFASVGLRDCYLANANAAEVYLVHHHDEVEVFIPDPEGRERLFREVEEAGWLFDYAALHSPDLSGPPPQ